jgi:hypothetical protein
MTMKIELNDEQLKATIGEAILRSIDEKTREALIKNAIEHLLAPTQGSSYEKSHGSLLEKAFKEQVTWTAQQLIREMLDSDDALKSRIKALISAAAEKALLNEKLVENLANAVQRALLGRDF